LNEAIGVLNVQSRRPTFSLLRLMAVAENVPEVQRPRKLFAESEQDGEDGPVDIEIRPLLVGNDLTALAASRQPDVDFSGGAIQRLLTGLSEDFAEVLDELALLLGTIRSRRVLIDRF